MMADNETDVDAIKFPARYIGDGVYASFDGYNIWLKTQEGNEIALEPKVMRELREYQADLYKHYGKDVP